MNLDTFAITSTAYARAVFIKYFARYWWAYALPLLTLIGLTCYDLNYLFTILVLCFIIYPFALTMVYYNYMLTKEIRWSILEKSLTTDSDGLHLRTDRLATTLLWEEFDGYTTTSKLLLFRFKVRSFTYFAIPFSAFKNSDDLRQFVAILNQHGVVYK